MDTNELWPEPKFLSDDIQFCPICSQNNLNTQLKLYQINLTTAVYLCQRKNCIYPNGFGWSYVERNIDDMIDSDSNSDIPNSETNSYTSVSCNSQENVKNLMDELDKMIFDMSSSTQECSQLSDASNEIIECSTSMKIDRNDSDFELDFSDIFIDNKNADLTNEIDGLLSETLNSVHNSYIDHVLCDDGSSQNKEIITNESDNCKNIEKNDTDVQDQKICTYNELQVNENHKNDDVIDTKENDQNMKINSDKNNETVMSSIINNSFNLDDSKMSVYDENSSISNSKLNQCIEIKNEEEKIQFNISILKIEACQIKDNEITLKEKRKSIFKQDTNTEQNLNEENMKTKVDTDKVLKNTSFITFDKIEVTNNKCSNIIVEEPKDSLLKNINNDNYQNSMTIHIEQGKESAVLFNDCLNSNSDKDLEKHISDINSDKIKNNKTCITKIDDNVHKTQNNNEDIKITQTTSISNNEKINCKIKLRVKQKCKNSALQSSTNNSTPNLNPKKNFDINQKSSLNILKAISRNKKTKSTIQNSLSFSEKNVCNIVASDVSNLNSNESSKKFEPFTFTL